MPLKTPKLILLHSIFPLWKWTFNRFGFFRFYCFSRQLKVWKLLLPYSLFILVISDKNLAKNRTKRIINGLEAEPYSFPYQVQIWLKSNHQHLCGGTIVGNVYILTAAHCFLKVNGNLGNPNEYQVLVGSFLFNRGIPHDIWEYYIPDDYDHSSAKSDIAVLKVSEFNSFQFWG